MRRHAPATPSSEIDALLTLIDRALDSQIEALGPRPRAWRALADVFALGEALDEAAEARAALLEIHRLLFGNAARPVEARQAWVEAQATAAAARALAAAARGSPSTAALAALVSHGAEAFVLRAIGAVEFRRGSRLDQATVGAVVAPLAPIAAAGISRHWKLAAAIAAAARDVRGVPEQRSPSLEAKAVYFARLLAAARPGRGFAAPGLDHELRQALGIGAREIDGARTAAAAAERVALDLSRELPLAAEFEAAG